jgi:hypothetical protein
MSLQNKIKKLIGMKGAIFHIFSINQKNLFSKKPLEF